CLAGLLSAGRSRRRRPRPGHPSGDVGRGWCDRPMTTPRDDHGGLAVQEAILAGGHHVVHGPPGSGKTTTAVATFTRWLTQGGTAGVLLVPTRRRAAVLRDEVARRV